MSIENQVEEILFDVIGEINSQLPEDKRIEKKKSTSLFGEEGVLDSLALVNLIVAFEQRIQDDLSFAITLADEKAMSQKNSPFRSVESLADYTVMLIQEKSNG